MCEPLWSCNDSNQSSSPKEGQRYGGTSYSEQNRQVYHHPSGQPESSSYTEEFELPYRPGMNVISALMEIQRNPVNKDGKSIAPVCWESNCLEEVCGACSMVINGKPRQACAALIDKLEQPVRIEPMKTFPVVRDLVIDRTRMFNALKRVKAWIPIDGTYDLGPGPRMPEKKRQWAYELSKCMTCGVCLEACPNVNEKQTLSARQHFPKSACSMLIQQER